MKVKASSFLQRIFSKLTPQANASKVKKIGLEALKGFVLLLLSAGFGALTLASHGIVWAVAGAAIGGACGMTTYAIMRLRQRKKPGIIP